MSALEDMIATLGAMDHKTKQRVQAAVTAQTGDRIWMSNPGPQTTALRSFADVLLYGGGGGGGKTDLLCGMALTEHKRTLLMRPQATDLGALIDRCTSIAGTKHGLNRSEGRFRYKDRDIDFGGAASLDAAESWQGNPHDLLGFDEGCQFLEDVIRFLMGWNRSADDTLEDSQGDIDRLRYFEAQGKYPVGQQRVRTIMASNPPLDAQGGWIINMFRPWLDVNLPTAQRLEHGELAWVITDPDGKDLWVDGPMDIRTFNGVDHVPKSRTFIPASLSDNPFLINTGYKATLDAMPEPLRSAIRDGNFMAAREDDAFQVIPSAWVHAANDRWRDGKPRGVRMTAMGLDVARGGKDDTVFAPRYALWFDELIRVPGRDTPDGPTVAALAAGLLRDGAMIGVDNIGVGADAETSLKNAGLPFETQNGSEGSQSMTRDGSFGFYNRRADMWWALREGLDPDYGLDVALPPDTQLIADLTAPTYSIRPGKPPKILIESKDEMKKRLGRSPDSGDAVVYSYATAGLYDQEISTGRVLGTPQPSEQSYNPLKH